MGLGVMNTTSLTMLTEALESINTLTLKPFIMMSACRCFVQALLLVENVYSVSLLDESLCVQHSGKAKVTWFIFVMFFCVFFCIYFHIIFFNGNAIPLWGNFAFHISQSFPLAGNSPLCTYIPAQFLYFVFAAFLSCFYLSVDSHFVPIASSYCLQWRLLSQCLLLFAVLSPCIAISGSLSTFLLSLDNMEVWMSSTLITPSMSMKLQSLASMWSLVS